jgi:hypothetical protein
MQGFSFIVLYPGDREAFCNNHFAASPAWLTAENQSLHPSNPQLDIKHVHLPGHAQVRLVYSPRTVVWRNSWRQRLFNSGGSAAPNTLVQRDSLAARLAHANGGNQPVRIGAEPVSRWRPTSRC